MNVGDRVKDQVTGFEGIVVAKTEWLHGCVRLTVQPEKLDKDGKPREPGTFDEPQLLLLKAGVVKTRKDAPKDARNYGPRDDKAALRR